MSKYITEISAQQEQAQAQARGQQDAVVELREEGERETGAGDEVCG